MAKIQKDTLTERMKKPVVIYPTPYLEGFGRSINKYRKDVTLSTGEKLNLIDWDEVYFRAGVKTKKGGVTWYLDNGIKKFNIEKFEEVRRQYDAMVAGRDYAKERQLEDLDQTADEIEAEKVFSKW